VMAAAEDLGSAIFDALRVPEKFAAALELLGSAALHREDVLVMREEGAYKRSILEILCTSREFGLDGRRDEWAAAARRVAALLTVDDVLARAQLWRSHLTMATSCGSEDWAVAMAERCLGSPLFTKEHQQDVIRAATTAAMVELAELLATNMDPSALLEGDCNGDCCLSLALKRSDGVCFQPIAQQIPEDLLLQYRADKRGKTVLHLAASLLRWEAVDFLVERVPELAAEEGAACLAAVNPDMTSPAPPIEVYVKLVQATPVELLMRPMGYWGQTALHAAVGSYWMPHVEALLQHLPPEAKAIQDSSGSTALDVAEQRARGAVPYRDRYGQERFNAEGAAMAALLAMGRMTKAAPT